MHYAKYFVASRKSSWIEIKQNTWLYRTLIRLLLCVNSHMNEQFVSRVERSCARATLPETGELILATRRRCRAEDALVSLVAVALHGPPAVAVRVCRKWLHVPPLNMPHQTFLLRENAPAVDPMALISRDKIIVRWFRAICNVIWKHKYTQLEQKLRVCVSDDCHVQPLLHRRNYVEFFNTVLCRARTY